MIKTLLKPIIHREKLERGNMMDSFGNRLKEMRKNKGATLEKMAEDLKTTQATLSRYENNLSEPNITFLKEIANYLNTSTDYLLGLDNKKTLGEENLPEEIINLIRKYSLEDLEVIGFLRKNKLSNNQVKAIIETFLELNNKIK